MKKFINAYNGLKIAFKDKAVVIQIVLGIFAIVGGIIIKLDFYEWLAFMVSIFMVIGAEMINLVIEHLANYLSKEYDDRIKVIKDLSAGLVLFLCLGALVVCLFVVIRRII